MDNTTKHFVIASWNSRGHGDNRIDYMKKLLQNVDVLMIQEHWYFENDLNSIVNSMDGIHVYGTSGMDPSNLLHGRPYGGCAILYSKHLKCKFTPVDSVSSRCCAVIMELPDLTKVLLFNVYMPCDTEHDQENAELYLDVLTRISHVRTSYPDICNIIIGGDFNTDLIRINSLHTISLLDYLPREGLALCCQCTEDKVMYTYENSFTGGRSKLDMFIVSESLAGNVSGYFAIHEGDNLSDHSPIVMNINLNVQYSLSEERAFNKKVSWKKAKETDILSYKQVLYKLLNKIDVPLNAVHCNNMLCKEHVKDIDIYYSAIIASCIEAASRCIPTTSKPKIAGWNDHVKQFKYQSILWHRIWLENGCPHQGLISDIKRKTHAKYKQAVKLVKRNQSDMRAAKMATALQSQDKRNFWCEMKRINNNRSSLPNVVDDAHGDKNITRTFADKYKDLYNSVSYNVNDMNAVRNELENNIASSCKTGACKAPHTINVDDVMKAVLRLKPHKADGVENASSDTLINSLVV